MSHPQEAGGSEKGEADRKRHTEEKGEGREQEGRRGGETETSSGTFSSSPLILFPNTSESNWTKTVI